MLPPIDIDKNGKTYLVLSQNTFISQSFLRLIHGPDADLPVGDIIDTPLTVEVPVTRFTGTFKPSEQLIHLLLVTSPATPAVAAALQGMQVDVVLALMPAELAPEPLTALLLTAGEQIQAGSPILIADVLSDPLREVLAPAMADAALRDTAIKLRESRLNVQPLRMASPPLVLNSIDQLLDKLNNIVG